MPSTPIASGRFGSRLMSMTGSARPAKGANSVADGGILGQLQNAVALLGEPSSAAETSMPSDSTPRMTPLPSVVPARRG